MPQVIAAMIAGYAIYVGLKWLSHILSQAQEAARRMEEERRARAAPRTPKDHGARELDPQTGIYRPRGARKG